MRQEFYDQLANKGLNQESLTTDEASLILNSTDIELLPLLNSAYTVRKKYWDNRVTIHIINNGQNGYCPEDCHYCAQAKSSEAQINEYPLKSDEEFLAEAKNAYEKGAHRYCMVFAGRGPSIRRTEHLASLVRAIKSKYPIEVCISAGLLDEEKARVLKEAGLDRLNHNLNTSEGHYPKICTTHTFNDRLNTLKSARNAGIQLCSGVIVGMGESLKDIIDVAFQLKKMHVESIPVNFLIPIEGTKLNNPSSLTPQYCLRVLCLFRFLNPTAEIRVAAGREINLRGMEVMALYPANSLFLQGYLNAKGTPNRKTLEMIKDAGFTVECDKSLDELLQNESNEYVDEKNLKEERLKIKNLLELRPFKSSNTNAVKCG